MKPSDYLKKGWCQRATARNTRGQSVDVRSGKAVAWCLWGALHVERNPQAYALRKAIFRRVGDLFDFNDAPERTQAECVVVMMEAEKEVGVSCTD